MKWKNPGHEFDAVYKEMCAKQEFYFFGAGDYGRQLRPIMQDEIKILGYIDNDVEKQGTLQNGLPCQALEEIAFTCGRTGIIIGAQQDRRAAKGCRLSRECRLFYH